MTKLFEIIEKPLTGEWGQDDLDGTGFPVLRTTNFTNIGEIKYENIVTRKVETSKAKSKYLQKKDIIIEKSGGSETQPVGRVVFFDGKEETYLFNNFTSVLRLKETSTTDAKFLFYELFYNYKKGGTKKFQNRTTGIHNLKLQKFVESFEISLPPLETQQKIAATLDTAAALLKLRQQQLAELEALIQSVFYEMFGDTARNTKGWRTGTIRDVVSEVKYGTSKPAVEGGKYNYLRMNNITYDGHLDLTSLKYIDIPEKEVEKYIVRRGDVLFNRTNSKELVGKTCVFNQDKEMIIAGYIIRLRVNERVLSEYLSAVLNSRYGKATLFGMCKAIIGQANINAQELQKIKLSIPPIELQKEYVKVVNQVAELKLVIQKSLEESDTLFNGLMQKYFD